MHLPFNPGTLVDRIVVKSAVNASLWACVVVSIPTFVMAINTSAPWLQVAFFVVGLLPVLCFAVSYMYLVIKNPSFLRSEEYQLKAESLRILGDKDNPPGAVIAHHVTSVTNPELPAPHSQNEHE